MIKALDNNMCFHAFLVFKIAFLIRSSERLMINITFLLRIHVCTLFEVLWFSGLIKCKLENKTKRRMSKK